jgi:hypothetical protein
LPKKVRHVDIFSNDPLAGTQALIARVQLNGQPELELFVDENAKAGKDYFWSYLCSRVPDVDPHKEAEKFLKALPVAIGTTYVGASPVHQDEDCRFADVHVKQIDGPGAAA